jgi:hypothetical protein
MLEMDYHICVGRGRSIEEGEQAMGNLMAEHDSVVDEVDSLIRKGKERAIMRRSVEGLISPATR